MSARWLFAFNLPCYGGGLRIAPQADGSDGLLDVCTFRRGGLWHGLRYVAAVLLRQQHRLADFAVHRVARGCGSPSEAEVPYQLDGDPGGFLPVEIEVAAGTVDAGRAGKRSEVECKLQIENRVPVASLAAHSICI